MPLYLIEHPSALLNMNQKEQICKEITRIHCAMTGAIPSVVNIVFRTTDDNVSQWADSFS
jgi:phenylpyruvate tautomerase PptA (4-oxalocrotonate tautomerase family)